MSYVWARTIQAQDKHKHKHQYKHKHERKGSVFVSGETNKCIQYNWGETLHLCMSLYLCLSHSCERPYDAYVVHVNQPCEPTSNDIPAHAQAEYH